MRDTAHGAWDSSQTQFGQQSYDVFANEKNYAKSNSFKEHCFDVSVQIFKHDTTSQLVANGPLPPDLVTVVIPAFNASATIGQTLYSVRAQTHQNLEIIVVDDGSTDATARMIQQHISEDPRIRVIKQSNSGVAAARNRGISEAAGDYIAPIDADDLWRPEKIEKQLSALHRGGEAVGLVYTWSARIDANNGTFEEGPGASHAGTVTHEICCRNFIGNGSAVLMRKAAVLEAGGYDQSLRARSAEGVEDWLLYFRIATRYQFAVVPEHLTGYRYLPTCMSMNIPKMLRGHDIVYEEMIRLCPELPEDIIKYKIRNLTEYQYVYAYKSRSFVAVVTAASYIIRENFFEGTIRIAITTMKIILSFARCHFKQKIAGSERRKYLVEDVLSSRKAAVTDSQVVPVTSARQGG